MAEMWVSQCQLFLLYIANLDVCMYVLKNKLALLVIYLLYQLNGLILYTAIKSNWIGFVNIN